VVIRKERAMKLAPIALAAALAVFSGFAYAQSGAPSGRGATTGDPAALQQIRSWRSGSI